MRLLELGPEVAAMLEDGSLEMGHARALLALDPAMQRTAALEVVGKGLTARATEALVRRLKVRQIRRSLQSETTRMSSVYKTNSPGTGRESWHRPQSRR